MVNTKQYAWADLTVVVAGRIVTGIRGAKYSSKQEKETIYGKGDKPQSIQKGNKSYEGSLTLLQNEVEALIKAAGGDLLDANMTVTSTYGNPENGDAMITDIIKGAEFTELPKELKQGDKNMEIELPFIALDIEYNVI